MTDNSQKPVIRTFRQEDEEAVVDLWRRCDLVVPANDPHVDIARKIAFQPDLFLVMELDGRIVGAAMAGYEGHRAWVNYLAVDPGLQGIGYGRMIMDAIEERVRPLGCQKINLQVRTSNLKVIGFYEHLGFISDEVVGLGKRLT